MRSSSSRKRQLSIYSEVETPRKKVRSASSKLMGRYPPLFNMDDDVSNERNTKLFLQPSHHHNIASSVHDSWTGLSIVFCDDLLVIVCFFVCFMMVKIYEKLLVLPTTPRLIWIHLNGIVITCKVIKATRITVETTTP